MLFETVRLILSLLRRIVELSVCIFHVTMAYPKEMYARFCLIIVCRSNIVFNCLCFVSVYLMENYFLKISLHINP